MELPPQAFLRMPVVRTGRPCAPMRVGMQRKSEGKLSPPHLARESACLPYTKL
jgi:hypothetical protein